MRVHKKYKKQIEQKKEKVKKMKKNIKNFFILCECEKYTRTMKKMERK